MSADVPADKAQFGVGNAGCTEGACDVRDAVERDCDMDRRLVLGLLVRQWAGDGLPGEADADFRRLDGTLQDGVVADTLAERLYGAARKLVFAVAARERRIARANRERMEDDLEVLVGVGAEFVVEEA